MIEDRFKQETIYKVNKSGDQIVMTKGDRKEYFPAIICAPGSRQKIKEAYEKLHEKQQ